MAFRPQEPKILLDKKGANITSNEYHLYSTRSLGTPQSGTKEHPTTVHCYVQSVENACNSEHKGMEHNYKEFCGSIFINSW